jgi:hypothetical protein
MQTPETIDLRPKPPSPPSPSPPPAHPPAFPSPLPQAGGAAERLFCSHCGHDQSRTDDTEITDEDKLRFVQAVLGQKRFEKEYRMLGGSLVVGFRTLTNEETDMAFTQAAYDVQSGVVAEIDQYFRTVSDYRLALGLRRLDLPETKHHLPELWGYTTPEPPKNTTKLKYIVPFIYDRILVSETLRRACNAAFVRFNRLVEKLEAHIDHSNFWPAIDARR